MTQLAIAPGVFLWREKFSPLQQEQLLGEVKGDRSAPIALICRTGNRTTQVQRYLQSQGFTQVYNVREGMAGSGAGPGWLKRGLPVDTCTTQC